MFEFDKYDGPRRSQLRPREPYRPLRAAKERAFLLWGEHCIECAAPDCYASCDLYQARPDLRCRRFTYGIFRNRAFPAASGYGAEVRFKQWGKLEARGNGTLFPHWAVTAAEHVALAVSRIVNPLGRTIGRAVGDIRWAYAAFAASERLNHLLRRRCDPARLPDAFVVELYNPMDREAALNLGISVDRSSLKRNVTADQLPRPVYRKLRVPPGHFVERIPGDAFAAIVESGLPFNMSITPIEPDAHLVFLTLDFVRDAVPADQLAPIGPPQAPHRPAAKCVVFDLDNTLWDGVLVEGPVRLRDGICELFAALDRRGILVSVASKNAQEEALDKLREFGLEDYLLFPSINWGPKSDSLKRIAADLDIGIDTLMFVDDNPFEREQVQRCHPQIEALPDTAIATLLDHPRLAGSATAEASQRRLMYRRSMQRQAAAASFGDDYLAFLKSCDIRIEVRPSGPEDFERIAELVQRTNQLNFSGRKYGRDEIAGLIADPGLENYVVVCSDKFGSYGTVGFCLAQRVGDTVRVLDLMLSCRVQGKFIEQALLHHLTHRSDWQAQSIEVAFQRTARNKPAEAVLAKLGFAIDAERPSARRIAPGDFKADFIHTVGRWP